MAAAAQDSELPSKFRRIRLKLGRQPQDESPILLTLVEMGSGPKRRRCGSTMKSETIVESHHPFVLRVGPLAKTGGSETEI